MRFLKKFLLPVLLALTAAGIAGSWWLSGRYTVPILMYHNVSPVLAPGMLNNVAPDAFARQMEYLKSNGYQVISLDDLVRGIKQGTKFAHKTVVITFDDGYVDNYTQAFPILSQYGYPATVFIVSDVVGTPGRLTWDQIRAMDTHGFSAGAHTRHHVYLPDASSNTARDEISGSKQKIEEEVGHPVRYFAYPSGGLSPEAARLVQEAGFDGAVTTNRGSDPLNRDSFQLNRVRLKSGDSNAVLWAKLSGYYNLFRKPRCGKACKDVEY